MRSDMEGNGRKEIELSSVGRVGRTEGGRVDENDIREVGKVGVW